MRVRTILVGLAILLVGCGGGYKERKAPCSHPIQALGYLPTDHPQCGPLSEINPDPSHVLAAIDAQLRNEGAD